MNRISRPLLLFIGILAAYFIFLAFLILRSDYVMMDTVWTLWHQAEPPTIFHHWSIQGRALGGCLLQWLFSRADKIANIRFIRLLSWAGWAGFCALLFRVLKRVQRSGYLDSGDWTIRLTVAFTASCLSVVLYIGWANCSETFVPALLSLTAGLLLFEQTAGGGAASTAGGPAPTAGGPAPTLQAGAFRIPFWLAALVLALAVASLFFYQSCYPFLLLPFYCVYLNRKDGKFTASMLAAMAYFIAGLAVYYVLFRYSLFVSGFEPSERTALRLTPLDRLSFFFSYPMNQAFNLNFFFNTQSGVSQAVFPVLMTAWVLFTFLYRKGPFLVRLRYVLGIVFWWILGYLPQLIAQESEGPYRTMPVLSVMVFLLIADAIGPLIKEGRARMGLGFALAVVFLVRGGYVYYSYISLPYSEEYRTVRAAVSSKYNNHIKNVVFVLAGENGFLPRFGVYHFKDEFAMPSIHKDWTPEPLVKQLVYELTGNRREAEMLKFSVYTKVDEIPDRSVLSDPTVLFIDAHTLF